MLLYPKYILYYILEYTYLRGLTAVVKAGTSGWRYSHNAPQIFRPFSRRKFWKSDSFNVWSRGVKRYTNSYGFRERERELGTGEDILN